MILIMKSTEHDKDSKIALTMVFVVYVIILVYFLLFAEDFDRDVTSLDYRYNLIPFKEIARYLNNSEVFGIGGVLLNIAGNVAVFIPFGFLIAVLHKVFRKVHISIFAAAAFSAIMETLQLLTKVGSFDVDDIILNTLGGLLGLIAFFILRPIYVKHRNMLDKKYAGDDEDVDDVLRIDEDK